MSTEPHGHELPILLLAAFRTDIDELHAGLAEVGHPDARPLHGFVLQALGPHGVSSSELARRLGVTKQGAAKHVHMLERLGYVEVTPDPTDARSRLIRPTPRGVDLIVASARVLDTLRARWRQRLGSDRLGPLLADLTKLAATDGTGTDVLGWLGA